MKNGFRQGLGRVVMQGVHAMCNLAQSSVAEKIRRARKVQNKAGYAAELLVFQPVADCPNRGSVW